MMSTSRIVRNLEMLALGYGVLSVMGFAVGLSGVEVGYFFSVFCGAFAGLLYFFAKKVESK